MSTSSRIPPRFIDPVTSELMVDPVVLKNGRTVDRATARATREPIVADNVDLRGDLFEQYPAQARAYEQRRNGPPAPADHTRAVNAHLVDRPKHVLNIDPSTPWASAPGEPPDHLCDPITTEIMSDPVVMSDGRTVDRKTAQSLKKSPWTREDVHLAVDNVDLRDELFVRYPNRAYRFIQVDPVARQHVLWAMIGEENVHRLTSSTGRDYWGTAMNNLAHGIGIATYPSGDIHVGEMKYGLSDGQGATIYANGDRHEGTYEKDKKHGQGIYTWSRGARYEGAFKNDKKHGQGVATWRSGERYEGAYENDKRHGQGVYTWANGERHEGAYKNGRRHGQGVYTLPSGEVIRGRWENGIMKSQENIATAIFRQIFSKLTRS